MKKWSLVVRPEKIKALEEKINSLGIKEEEVVEKFIKGKGPGGQKINKTSSCVYLKHLPSGIEVKCQQQRSQALNRFLAWRLLVNKIEAKILGKLSEEEKRRYKIRKQKQRRSRRAKEKILAEKRKHSEKKERRRKIKISSLSEQ